MNSLAVLIVLLVAIVPVFEALEPFSTSFATVAGVALSAFGAGVYRFKCRLTGSCCEEINDKDRVFRDLRKSLEDHLFGQHIVKNTVLKAVMGHIKNNDPQKALVMSFHGWTGGGKNHVSRLIADALFEDREKQFVHTFVSPLHFPHRDHIDRYKDQLRRWIPGNVSRCYRSLFIFDEIDKMPEGLMDAITPYLDHHPEIDGIDYRKTIFLLLSNTAGSKITNRALEYWKKGRAREAITHKEMEEVIINASYNEKGGLWHSALISKNLISSLVPFLPLEQHHVKMCIHTDLRNKGHSVSEQTIEKVAKEMQYFPEDTKLFSKSGCKRVSDKVDLIVEETEGDEP